jgi:single-stranded-DNA-specific exonuclease
VSGLGSDQLAQAQLVQELGLTQTVASWLSQQGIGPATVAQFLEPRLSELTQPDGMAGRQAAAQRLATAIRKREHVVVFGDYDCDGITSTAILTEVLETLGGRVTPLLANRFGGGYGVSAFAVTRILAAKPQLLVTCDCGSSDHDTLEQVRAAGVDIVVIDHHLVPDRPLPALAFLNPHRPDCGFAFKGLASCGLVLSVAAALRKELNVTLDIRAWLDLVAVGTIADVAPLVGDNRALVRHGLIALRAAKRPGVAALLEIAKINRDLPITGRDVAFRIAPHLNAPGRLGAPDLALALLLAKDADSARAVALQIEALSIERRAKQELMISEAEAQILAGSYATDAAIVVGHADWSHGIVGIAAGRIADKYQRPVVVLAFEGEHARGSVRGPKGVRLHDAVSLTADALVRFGGHQAALGLELELGRVEEFRRRFCLAVGQCPSVDVAEVAALPMATGDDPARVLADLDRLEPCGEGNPRPRLLISGSVLHARSVSGGHLKLDIMRDGMKLGCFAVNQGERARELRGNVTLVGDLRHNAFPGAAPVEVFVEHVTLAAD